MSPSSRFAVRHYSNAALVFLFPPSHSSMQGVERLFQETHVPLCRIGGKCAGFRAKTVEVSGHLPSSLSHMVNALKVRQNRPQGSNLAFKVRLRADDQLPNELVFEYT